MSIDHLPEFSYKSRKTALDRFEREVFDLLIVGGGITGAAAARDAAMRGLKVALVDRGDFANGTSCRSSKLIHGGLRYLENFEFGLVFEALAERSHLLKTAPHMVRPLPFYFPVFKGDPTPRFILRLGMWLYDLLALFRTPKFHRGYSKKGLLREIPFLRPEGLQGGFRYYDASMWDDVLTIETLRSAAAYGAAIANYVEATTPIWSGERISGFRVREMNGAQAGREFELRAHQVIICAGPWTDRVGATLSKSWSPWLSPSKGVHLVFDLKRIPIPGAMVMSHPEDGRISFVIPRPDFGAGVVIVGTTDSPSPADPAQSTVEPADVEYLMGLLQRYFPELKLTASDILSAYVGVRPLMGNQVATLPSPGGEPSASMALQKVSREHHIGNGPGGAVVVAGGKYTTHRKMAEEIIDFAIHQWRKAAEMGKAPTMPPIGAKRSLLPVNPRATREATAGSRQEANRRGVPVPETLWERYGADALDVFERRDPKASSPEGFEALDARLRYSIKNEMTLHLDDFYFRREPLFLGRADHGLPWAEALARVWAEELGLGATEAAAELERLKREIEKDSAWTKQLKSSS